MEHITSLFAALYFFVIMRVKAVTSGAMVDREAYVPQRKEILALLNQARQEVNVKDLDEEEFWVGWQLLKSKDFDLAVEQVNQRDWLTGDWYKGIAEVMKQGQHDDNDALEDDDESGPQLRARRADTMFQDKYDFLSDARRSDYAVWKDNMLSRISQFMATSNSMEIDTQ